MPKHAQFAVAEALIWRCVEMLQRLDRGALSGPSGNGDGSQRQVAAATDAPVQIALVSLSDLAAAVRCVKSWPAFWSLFQSFVSCGSMGCSSMGACWYT